MRKLALALSIAPLAACQPAEEPASSSPDPGLIATPAALAGEYRVAGVDGDDIDLPHAITASIDERTIRVSADCLNFAWAYRFEEGVLVTETTPTASCRRGLLPPEEAVRAAFDSAALVRRTPANGIELSGEGRTVLLFSQ